MKKKDNAPMLSRKQGYRVVYLYEENKRINLAWSYFVASNDHRFFDFDIPQNHFKLISISKPI